jgi:DNA-binding MarR family transcriptional regulator
VPSKLSPGEQSLAPAETHHSTGIHGGHDVAESVPEAQSKAAPRPHYDVRILRALRRIIHSVDLYSRQLAASNQITAPQLVCLLHIVNKGPVTATAISREVHLTASTVVGILDRLEEKGLVMRQRSLEDRRLVQVTATDAGIQLARRAPSPLQQSLANGVNALPETEQATIANSLERIVALMETEGVDAEEAASPILATGPINPGGS